MNIVAISGSLRKGSFNSALVREFVKLAPSEMKIEIVDIGNLPLYDTDLEATFPPAAAELKKKIEGADGVILSTPEFNRTVSGALSNAIDWLSRPYGKNSFVDKPVLVAGVSAGKIGTAVAQSQLKHTLMYLSADIVEQPELYLGPATEVFEVSADMMKAFTEVPGPIKSDATKELLQKGLAALALRVTHRRHIAEATA